jgi:hypothetical protein
METYGGNNIKPTFSPSKPPHFDHKKNPQVLKIADGERAMLLEQLSRSCNDLAEGRQGRGLIQGG